MGDAEMQALILTERGPAVADVPWSPRRGEAKVQVARPATDSMGLESSVDVNGKDGSQDRANSVRSSPDPPSAPTCVRACTVRSACVAPWG